MKRYAVSYLSFFENTLKMGIVEAVNYREAIKEGLLSLGNWESVDIESYLSGVEEKDFGNLFFDGDFQCKALEV